MVIDVALTTGAAAAGPPVGNVAELDTTAEAPRGEPLSKPESIGTDVNEGETLVTKGDGELLLHFQDRSRIQVSKESTIVIGRDLVTPAGFRSALELQKGLIRVMVTRGTPCKVETPVSISECGGTDFIVSYDPSTQKAEIIGIDGIVEVYGRQNAAAERVRVHRREQTSVVLGEGPSVPVRLDDTDFDERVEHLDFVGSGRPESLSTGHRLTLGVDVPSDFTAPAGPQLRRGLVDEGQNPTIGVLTSPNPAFVPDSSVQIDY